MKEALRETILTKRLALSLEEVNAYSLSLIKQIRALPAYQSAKHVGLYAPIKNEPNLLALLTDAKQFYLPKVVDLDMIYVPYHADTKLEKSGLGILEPLENTDASQQLDMIIIPGIVFDPAGNRIGFGKGYFDRFLLHIRPAHVIGVAYPFQMEKRLMTSRLDVPVDLVLVA
ncbi:MAG: 5-formyltetrahydrofolate cyclo-ligase [Bacilli bacterium]